LVTTTIRDLRQHQALAPGGPDFDRLVKALLPLVYGSACQLVPEDPASAEKVTVAVWQALAVRWRRLPRRALLASWLLRTTWLAAMRLRRHERLPEPAAGSDSAASAALFRALHRLPPRLLDVVTLVCIAQRPITDASAALHKTQPRLHKRLAKALEKLGRRLRKKQVDLQPQMLLGRIALALPGEAESQLLDRLHESLLNKNDRLVVQVLRSWRWIGFKRFVRRCALAFGTLAGILIVAALAVVCLARQGDLTMPMLRFGGRQLTKEFPELAQSARPWPAASSNMTASQQPPATSAELYNLTSIWSAKLFFTARQWRQLQPGHVPPMFNMNNPDGTMSLRNPKAHRSGLAGVIGLDFNWTEAKLEFAGTNLASVGVRYRGNGTFVNSLFGPKQSFKVEVSKSVKTQTLGGLRTLNFVNAIPDNSYLHDALAEQLFRDLKTPAPRTTYAYLSVDVPGRFTNQALGLYVLVENIDSDFAADRFGTKEVPIFKPVTTHLFEDLGGDWKAYADIYDLKTHATPEQLERIVQFAQLVSHADDAEFGRRVGEFVDEDEFAAFLAGHVLLASYDGFLSNGQNFYVYLDPSSNKLGFIPWDHDHAWGEFGYISTADKREHASIWEPSTYHNRFLERMLKVEPFRTVYRQTLERAMSQLFTVDRLYRQIDEIVPIIRPAVAAESDFRLKRFDLAVSTNWLSGSRDGGAPEGPKAPVHQMKRFIAIRVASVRDQLDGRSQGVVLLNQRMGAGQKE
jgi:DNA-directed RNA polymerase specialized sigma24 family protein